ncbi:MULTISPECIES: hypothetical protein [unclassified Cellulophaga]|uniref:hypothetical protein n=1 Tax=unclassified Cellulophaga TaxID=2634405 RepID=UPI000C2C18D6|nr:MULTISPECIES: hypothetical protein [unclassified Cellulophaga]MDO6490987.1 hypothetical protein [Cellulophaga sp. 2_MG-2023]MDO6493819.1 hypothetical protein [Cellulophaga sp. 3_MG-2023]PKB44167.1 hypothetical protein AX016_2381 [Cellulophaga sp. RHA19]
MIAIRLDEKIDGEVQNLMIDTFEVVGANKGNLTTDDLLKGEEKLEQVFFKVKETGFYKEKEVVSLVKALNIEFQENNNTIEDALYKAWSTMVATMNKATSQEDFNAKFALFVPLVLKKMNEFKAQAS